MELLKLLNTGEIAAQIISFLILFFVLRRFVWGRFLVLLDRRKAAVVAGIAQIEDAKTDVARLKAEYEARLAVIDEESRRKIQEAVAEGQKITDELRRKAHRESQQIIDAARDHIRYELAKVKETIKEEIIDISLRAAESVIQEKLTEESDRKLVEDFIGKLDAAA